jgi:hypothetical protein
MLFCCIPIACYLRILPALRLLATHRSSMRGSSLAHQLTERSYLPESEEASPASCLSKQVDRVAWQKRCGRRRAASSSRQDMRQADVYR